MSAPFRTLPFIDFSIFVNIPFFFFLHFHLTVETHAAKTVNNFRSNYFILTNDGNRIDLLMKSSVFVSKIHYIDLIEFLIIQNWNIEKMKNMDQIV